MDTKLAFAKAALDELKKNLNSKFGTYFIVGNHEYFHGVKPIIDYVNSLGIKTLENENVYIGPKDNGFYLCGFMIDLEIDMVRINLILIKL